MIEMAKLRRITGITGVTALTYLGLIMPRMTHRPDREPYLRVLYAHRGLHDNTSDHPENSMAAFRRAVDAGYGIELDVQLTKDGVPVVFHDFTLARIARYDDDAVPDEIRYTVLTDKDRVYEGVGGISVAGKVSDYTWDELQHFHLLGSTERIPKFGDFLRMVDGKVPLVVEFKVENSSLTFDPPVCVTAWELLKDYKGVYCIESFHPFAVHWFKKNHPEIFRGQLAEEFYRDDPVTFKSPVYFALAMLFFNFFTSPDFIAYNHKHAWNLSRRLCHGLYRSTAAAWTIKSEEELEKARKHFDLFIFDSFVPACGPYTYSVT